MDEEEVTRYGDSWRIDEDNDVAIDLNGTRLWINQEDLRHMLYKMEAKKYGQS